MSRKLTLLTAMVCATAAASTSAQVTTATAGAPATAATLDPVKSLDPTGIRSRSTAISPVDSAIYTADEDGTIKRYKSDTGELVRTYRTGTARVNAIRISADGRKLVSGGADGYVRVFDADTGAEIKNRKHAGEVRDVWIKNDGTRVLSTEGTTVQYWNPGDTSGGVVTTWTAHKTEVLAIAATPDGTRAVSGGRDKIICTWEPETGNAVGVPFTAHLADVTAIAIDLSGRYVVSGDAGMIVCYWSPDDPALLRKFTELREPVVAIDIMSDGRRAIVAGANRAVLADPVDNKVLFELARSQYRNYTARIHPDQRKIVLGRDVDGNAAAGQKGTVKIYDLPTR